MKNELIRINSENRVSGRELHQFLEVETKYGDWMPRMIEYGFTEGEDFNFLKNEQARIEGSRQVRRIIDDIAMTIDMAKEIAMIQRSEKGKQARQYFIECEKRLKATRESKMLAIQQDYPSALRALAVSFEQNQALQNTVDTQKQPIGEYKPKADYTDKILKSKSLITTTQIAKDYGMSGQALNKILHDRGVQYFQSGQWLLYSRYHGMGYTHSETINITRADGRADVKLNTKWTQKGRLFIYALLKKDGILPVIEREDERIEEAAG